MSDVSAFQTYLDENYPLRSHVGTLEISQSHSHFTDILSSVSSVLALLKEAKEEPIAPPKVTQVDTGPIEDWVKSNYPAYRPSQVELQAWARLNDSILGFLLLFNVDQDDANLELLASVDSKFEAAVRITLRKLGFSSM